MDERTPVGGRRDEPVSCAWCGRPVEQSAGGRRRRYCRRSCRQRAYEQRQSLRAMALPEDSVVLSAVEAAELLDRMFAVRAGCEDLATALADGVSGAELRRMAAELVDAARSAERLR